MTCAHAGPCRVRLAIGVRGPIFAQQLRAVADSPSDSASHPSWQLAEARTTANVSSPTAGEGNNRNRTPSGVDLCVHDVTASLRADGRAKGVNLPTGGVPGLREGARRG